MTHPALTAGNVAVLTGAGLGIGRALAQRFSAMGLHVALLDVDAEQLHQTQALLPGDACAILCDVAEIEALEHARDRILSTWNRPPAVIVNNAVTRIGRGMDADLADWRRSVEINLWGVINGVRTFLPDLLTAGSPGMVVNVGSKQGITNPPGHPVYNLAKAAVKSYTESLAHVLRQDPDCQVSAHLLVPGWTTTGLNDHKPGAWLPEQVVDTLLEATARGSFYIVCPDDEVSPAQDNARILWGAEDITQDRPALSRWHPDWSERFKAKEPRT